MATPPTTAAAARGQAVGLDAIAQMERLAPSPLEPAAGVLAAGTAAPRLPPSEGGPPRLPQLQPMALSPDEVFHVSTANAAVMKALVEGLKDILTDTMLEVDETGIRCVNMDRGHVVLVYLTLRAERFEFYGLRAPQTVCLHMDRLHKVMGSMTSADVFEMWMRDSDRHTLWLAWNNPSSRDVQCRVVTQLPLLDMDCVPIHVPDHEYDVTLTLSAATFRKKIRDMKKLADIVEIKMLGREAIFTLNGHICKQNTNITVLRGAGDAFEAAGAEGGAREPAKITQGNYELKYIEKFTKCTKSSAMSNTVDLLMRNDHPLVLRYNVGDIGDLMFCLAEHVPPAAPA